MCLMRRRHCWEALAEVARLHISISQKFAKTAIIAGLPLFLSMVFDREGDGWPRLLFESDELTDIGLPVGDTNWYSLRMLSKSPPDDPNDVLDGGSVRARRASGRLGGVDIPALDVIPALDIDASLLLPVCGACPGVLGGDGAERGGEPTSDMREIRRRFFASPSAGAVAAASTVANASAAGAPWLDERFIDGGRSRSGEAIGLAALSRRASMPSPPNVGSDTRRSIRGSALRSCIGSGGTGGTGLPAPLRGGVGTISPPLIRRARQYGECRNGFSPIGRVAESWRVRPPFDARGYERRALFTLSRKVPASTPAAIVVPEIAESPSSEDDPRLLARVRGPECMRDICGRRPRRSYSGMVMGVGACRLEVFTKGCGSRGKNNYRLPSSSANFFCLILL